MRGLAAATRLLTRVRVGTGAADIPLDVGLWFPVVGAMTGAVVAGVLLSAGQVVPAAAAALLAVTFEVGLTGALHLDGLADTADAAGGHDPASRLAIMRDHSIGVYGAAALVLSLTLRATCLAALLSAPLASGEVAALMVASWTMSRTAMLAPAVVLPYAREDGTGRTLVTGLTMPVTAMGVAVAAVVVCTVAAVGPGWRPFVLGVGSACVTTALLTRWAATRLGGATGDVLGAVAEVGLTAGLMAQTAGLGTGAD